MVVQSIPTDPADALRRDASLPLWREAAFGLDWLTLQCSPVFAGQGIPSGDRSPVVVVPGLFASDHSLRDLRVWLSRIGYRPYLSRIGREVACPDFSIERLLETVDSVAAETGSRVRLVGHSLGGILARGAARQRPDLVSQVITLGSPVTRLSVHPAVARAVRALPGSCSGECLRSLDGPLASSVSQTCIYTKSDGIVDWRACLHPDARNLEVPGTHIGLIFNMRVYESLAAELAGLDAGRSREIRRAAPPAIRNTLAAA